METETKGTRSGSGEIKPGNISSSLEDNIQYLNHELGANASFDIIYRVIQVGGRNACMYLIDGFCKDELMQKMLQYFMSITPEEMPENSHEMSKKNIPHVEVDIKEDWEQIIYNILSGVFALSLTDTTNASSSIQEPIRQEVYRNRKRIKRSAAQKTALWKQSFLIPP